jgi:hypothetical protein
MIPDAATIARRRHLVTIIARSLIALFGAWVALGAVAGIGQIFQPIYSGGIQFLVPGIWNFLTTDVPQLLLVAALFLLEQRLVRWIVPMPSRHAACPTCGYSLKDLKSPICPECGTSLRA